MNSITYISQTWSSIKIFTKNSIKESGKNVKYLMKQHLKHQEFFGENFQIELWYGVLYLSSNQKRIEIEFVY